MLLAVISFVGVVLAYWPATTLKYGRLDDYVGLYESKSNRLDSLYHLYIDGGRVVPAALQVPLLSAAHSVSDLAYLRLVAVAGLGAAAAIVAIWASTKAGANRASWAVALPAGALLASLPGAQTVATWAVLAVQSWALPTALLGGIAIDRWHTRPDRLLGYYLGSALIVVAAFTYQPYAAVALLPVLLGQAMRFVRSEATSWKPPVVTLGVVILSLGANYALVTHIGSATADRVTKRKPVREVLDWFFTDYLPRTVDLHVPNSASTTKASAVILLILLLTPAIGGIRHLSLSLAVIAAWLITAGPMLGVGELWSSYRVVYPAQSALWVGALLVFGWTVLEKIPERPGTIPILVLTGFFICLPVLAVASHRAYYYYAVPNAADWRHSKCVVQTLSPRLNNHDQLKAQPYTVAQSPVIYGDEPGIIASTVPWAIGSLLWLANEEDSGGESAFDVFLKSGVPLTEPTAPGVRVVTVLASACEVTTAE